MKGFHERPARKTFPEAMPQTSVSRGRASVRNICITDWKHLSENTCRKTLGPERLETSGNKPVDVAAPLDASGFAPAGRRRKRQVRPAQRRITPSLS
jgi:hypothetical protein